MYIVRYALKDVGSVVGRFARLHPFLTVQAGVVPPAYLWGRGAENRRLHRLAATSQENYNPEEFSARMPSKLKFALGALTFPSGPVSHFFGRQGAVDRAIRLGKFQRVGVRVFPTQQEVREQVVGETPEIQEIGKVLEWSPEETQAEIQRLRTAIRETPTIHNKIIPKGWKVPRTRKQAVALPPAHGSFQQKGSGPTWVTFGPRPKGFKD